MIFWHLLMYIWYRHKFEWEMKTIKIFTIAIFSIFISQACTDATEVLNTQKDTTNTDTITRGCLASYELNPEDNNEKINQVYNKDKVKEGHWMNFEFVLTENTKMKTTRIKTEEGYYRKNKKEGFWKFFKKDGTIADSVEYSNNLPVKNRF